MAAILTGIDPYAAWTTTRNHALGTTGIVMDVYGASTWKYVKLRNETATVAVAGTTVGGLGQLRNEGDFLAYLVAPEIKTSGTTPSLATVGGAYDEYNTVVSDFTDAETIPVCAGAAFVSIPGVLATQYYGWIMIEGFMTSRLALGGATNNANLMCSTTDLSLTVSPGGTSAAAAQNPICGVAIVAATKNLRLRCFR
jgi:hypothetical protein